MTQPPITCISSPGLSKQFWTDQSGNNWGLCRVDGPYEVAGPRLSLINGTIVAEVETNRSNGSGNPLDN